MSVVIYQWCVVDDRGQLYVAYSERDAYEVKGVVGGTIYFEGNQYPRIGVTTQPPAAGMGSRVSFTTNRGNEMLTTTELIERMTPTALAEVIASIGQASLDYREAVTVDMLWGALVANVGEDEAAELLAAAQ